MNVKGLWDVYKHDQDFFKYFPDIFQKRPPPKDYFWKIFFALKKEECLSMIEQELIKLNVKGKTKDDKVEMIPEASKIFETFSDSGNIDLLSKLISSKAK